MQGEIAADYLKAHPGADKNQDGKIQYVLLEGEAGHQDAISRTDCSVKTLIENGIELEKLSYQFADWNRGAGRESYEPVDRPLWDRDRIGYIQ